MTCIAAIKHQGSIYMAGDSAGVAGLDICIRKDEKVFVKGDFVIGFTSSFRMGQLLRYDLTPPLHAPDLSPMAYMVSAFIPALRTCFKNGGFATTKEGVESGGCFLVGYKGRLFQIDSDFQVGESIEQFDAVGCGAPYALGAFHASGEKDALTRLKMALSIAEKCSAGVRAPFMFVEGGAA